VLEATQPVCGIFDSSTPLAALIEIDFCSPLPFRRLQRDGSHASPSRVDSPNIQQIVINY